MIIKKRTLVIFVLIIILGITIYLYLNKESLDFEEITQTEKAVLNQVEFPQDDLEDFEKGQNFFIDYKLERDRLRSQEIDMLREIIYNPNSDKEIRERAQEDLLKIIRQMEKELILENLIKGKGFEDAVIFFGDDSVNVIVKTQGLDDKQVAQICDIVSKGTGLSLDKITIIERK